MHFDTDYNIWVTINQSYKKCLFYHFGPTFQVMSQLLCTYLHYRCMLLIPQDKSIFSSRKVGGLSSLWQKEITETEAPALKDRPLRREGSWPAKPRGPLPGRLCWFSAHGRKSWGGLSQAAGLEKWHCCLLIFLQTESSNAELPGLGVDP